jgi:uncharacterized protein YbaR (Trm112 family)
MHIVLTDILTCPRCGPAHGLILLARRIEDRRALEGVLGCANCREQYGIANGAVHFGAEPCLPAAPAGAEDGGGAVRLGALLGITEGPAFVMLAGPASAHGPELAALVAGLEVIVVSGGAAGATAAPEPAARNASARGGAPAGVNVLGVGGQRLPLASGKVAGAALSGSAAAVLLEEGARVISPLGRLVLEDAPADAEDRLKRTGLRVLARDGSMLVAARG